MAAERQDAIQVLLAEDNQEGYDMLAEYLEACNYHVVRACDGNEAVRIAREQHPDIILMDIQMPELDGLAATRILKADDNVCRIPIIALTALATHGDREHCIEAGVDAYMSKPVSLKKVTKVMQSLLEREETDV